MDQICQRTQYAKGGVGRWYWDYRDKVVLDHLQYEGPRILDIGCGEGITLEKIINKYPGRSVIGIDNDVQKLNSCSKLNLPVQLGNVSNLEFGDDSFDSCLLLEVIEHLWNPFQAIREIHRVLKKDGTLLVLFPNDQVFRIMRLLFGKIKELLIPSGHIRQWIPYEIKRILQIEGFKIEKIMCIPFYFWKLSLNCLAVARKI